MAHSYSETLSYYEKNFFNEEALCELIQKDPQPIY